jgi:hypothetical protein
MTVKRQFRLLWSLVRFEGTIFNFPHGNLHFVTDPIRQEINIAKIFRDAQTQIRSSPRHTPKQQPQPPCAVSGCKLPSKNAPYLAPIFRQQQTRPSSPLQCHALDFLSGLKLMQVFMQVHAARWKSHPKNEQ